MEGINWSKVFFSAAITLALSFAVYYVFSGYDPTGIISDLTVEASDNIVYDSTTYTHSEVNEKLGLTFNYYFDENTDIYGIKVDKNYDYFATDIPVYYGQNDVFFMKCDQLGILYLAVANEDKSQYEVKDIVRINEAGNSIDINKTYNGITIKNFSLNPGLGWIANCEVEGKLIVKRILNGEYEYKDYVVTDSYTNLKLFATFSDETKRYEFSIDESTISSKPMTKIDMHEGEKIYDTVYFDLDAIYCGVIGKFNYNTNMWEIVKVTDVPLLDSTKDVYENNEVLYVEKFDMLVNRIKYDQSGKLQCFDKEGNYLNSYVYMYNPTLKEK